MPKKKTQPVRIGQVWEDNDPRHALSGPPRRFRVIGLSATHATCHPLKLRRGQRYWHRIRLDRFRPTNTGYRLVRGS